MNWFSFLLPLLAGIVGGNLVGATFQKFSLGPSKNSLLGLLGGGLGAAFAGDAAGIPLTASASMMSFGAVGMLLLGGLAGGSALTLIAGVIRRKIKRPE